MNQLWQENKGSISTLATISIVSVLMIIFLSINIGNIFAKKTLVEDTATQLAPIVLSRQLAPPDLDTPQVFAGAMQDSVGLTDADLPTITFGILNVGHATLPDGFYPFGNANTGVDQSISSTNPNFDNVAPDDYNTQDFAVQITINYNLNPLGDLLSFSTISLQASGRAATNFKKVDIDPEINDGCCCQQAAVLNPEYESTNIIFGCMYKKKDVLFSIPMLCFTGFSDFCADYYDCRGHFFENLFKGRVFSTFLDQYNCWITDLTDRIELVRDTIRSVSIEIWNG